MRHSTARASVETIREALRKLVRGCTRRYGEDALQSADANLSDVHTPWGALGDYDFDEQVPGRFSDRCEANFPVPPPDHGGKPFCSLGSSALMQGLLMGYFVMPKTLASYLRGQMGKTLSGSPPSLNKQSEAECPRPD